MHVHTINKNGEIVATSRPILSQFPDGQPHLKLYTSVPLSEVKEYQVHCSIRNPNELFNLMMVLDILDKKRESGYDSSCEFPNLKVFIYWLFGARMDRPIDQYQPSTLKVVEDYLMVYNRMVKFYLLDIHNDSILNLVHSEIPINDLVNKTVQDFSPDSPCDIYFPDKGAAKRYKTLFPDRNILIGGKTRDSQTGKLSGFHLESGERKSDKVLVVDDILDGGNTFIGQYDILNSLGYDEIGLHITHGIFSKGKGVLIPFSSVYYTNSFTFGRELEETDDGIMPKQDRLVLFKYKPSLNLESVLGDE